MVDIIWNRDEINWLNEHKDQINKVETPEEFKKFYFNTNSKIEGLDNMMGMIFLAEKFKFEYSWIEVRCYERDMNPQIEYMFIGGENINIYGKDKRFGNFGYLGFRGVTSMVCGHLGAAMKFYRENEGMAGPGDSIVYSYVRSQIEYFYDLLSSGGTVGKNMGFNLITFRPADYMVKRAKNYILNNLAKFKISVVMV